MKKPVLAVILIVVAIALIILGYSLIPPAKKRFDTATIYKLESFMNSSMKKYNAPGMLLGVWVPGRAEYVRAMGVADLKSGKPIWTEGLFRIGSLTKTFTGTVALQLVDEGLLSLDNTVDKYYEGVPNGDKITIRQLLNMTSGLCNYSESPAFGELFIKNRYHYWRHDQLVDIATAEKPYFAPGKGCHYSNTNTILLGLIIEKVTNSTLEKQIKKRVFDRLGMRHSTFPTTNTFEGEYIHGYNYNNGKPDDWSLQNPSWGWAAGGIISNFQDMHKYIRALGKGTLLSRKTQAERFKGGGPLPKAGFSTTRYCLAGFKLGGFVGHNGGMPGYINIAMYDPSTGAVVLIMLNTQPPQGDATLKMFGEVVKIIFPDRKL